MTIKKIIFQLIDKYGSEHALCLAIGIEAYKLRKILRGEIIPCGKTLLLLALEGVDIKELILQYKHMVPRYDVQKSYATWGTFYNKLLDKDPIGLTYEEYTKIPQPQFMIVKEEKVSKKVEEIKSGTAQAVSRKMRDLQIEHNL